jgi:hypothetical protein
MVCQISQQRLGRFSQTLLYIKLPIQRYKHPRRTEAKKTGQSLGTARCTFNEHHCTLTDLVLGHPGIYSISLELQHIIMGYTTLQHHLIRTNTGLGS